MAWVTRWAQCIEIAEASIEMTTPLSPQRQMMRCGADHTAVNRRRPTKPRQRPTVSRIPRAGPVLLAKRYGFYERRRRLFNDGSRSWRRLILTMRPNRLSNRHSLMVRGTRSSRSMLKYKSHSCKMVLNHRGNRLSWSRGRSITRETARRRTNDKHYRANMTAGISKAGRTEALDLVGSCI